MNDLWKRLATEKATEWLQVKIPPVLDEILSIQDNKSEYVKNLIIADYERQTAVKVKIMARYFPTEEEVKQLIAKGWQVDSEGWWWPVGEVGYGRNYKNAIKEQKKREIRQKKTAVKGGE